MDANPSSPRDPDVLPELAVVVCPISTLCRRQRLLSGLLQRAQARAKRAKSTRVEAVCERPDHGSRSCLYLEEWCIQKGGT
eukprot:3897070-Rhodomonas_salina.1